MCKLHQDRKSYIVLARGELHLDVKLVFDYVLFIFLKMTEETLIFLILLFSFGCHKSRIGLVFI